MKTVREQVVDLLIQIEQEKSYAQLSLKHALGDLERRDKALATELFYGTLKYQIQLDYVINQFSKTKVKKMKPLIRQILRMSVYQMLYLDKIPVSAVINEAVKIVKRRKLQGLSGFVNGVLRQIEREKSNIQMPKESEGLSYALSIRYALPEWMIKMWLESYTKDEVEKICTALNKRGVVAGRCNTLKCSMEALKESFAEEGIMYEPGHLLDEAFYIKKVDDLQHKESFRKGNWTVQDESAMLVAHVVEPKKGERILDMCSAPGGKSIQMAALMENEGTVVACDVHPHKLELIQKNAERLGASIVEPTLQDGTVYNEAFHETFDKVLLDAPCSGLGIMKGKPDIRLNKTYEDLTEIAKIQEQLFENAVAYLKPGGTLVYSTCTISKIENEAMVQKMKDKYGLSLNGIKEQIPSKLRPYIDSEGMLQVLPYVADTDGFFIASLKKG